MSGGKKKTDFLSLFNKKIHKQMVFDENYFDFTLTGGEFHTQQIMAQGKVKDTNDKITLSCNWFHITAQNIIKLDKITSQTFQPSVDDIDSRFMVQAVPVIEGKEYEGMPKQLEVGPLKMDPQLQEQINELLEKDMIIFQISITKILKVSEENQFELPALCELTLNLQKIKLDIKGNDESVVKEITSNLNAQFPCYEVIKETPDSLILNMDAANSFEVKSKDHIQRDLLFVAIKSSYGKSLCLENNSDSETGNSKRGSKDIAFDQTVQEFTVDQETNPITIQQIDNQNIDKIEESPVQEQKINNEQQVTNLEDPGFQNTLQQWKERENQILKETDLRKSTTKSQIVSSADRANEISPIKKKKEKMNVDLFVVVNENAKLKEDNQLLNDQLKKEQENTKQLTKKIKELQDQLQTCTKNFYDMDHQFQEQKKLIEQLTDQKVFLTQDINMYKGQCIALKEQINEQKQEIDVLMKRNRKSTVVSGLNEANQRCEQLLMQLQEKDLKISELNEQKAEQLEKTQLIEIVVEKITNELQHQRKRYDSLAQELAQERTMSQNQLNQVLEKQKKQRNIALYISDIGSSQAIENDNTDPLVEIARLKSQINHMEATIRSLKMAYDQDIRKGMYSKKKQTSGEIKVKENDFMFLKNLANQLAEIITEKELALQNQLRINKELMRKISEFDEKKQQQQ